MTRHHVFLTAYGAVLLLILPSGKPWRLWKQEGSEFKSQLQHFVVGCFTHPQGLHFPHLSSNANSGTNSLGGVMNDTQNVYYSTAFSSTYVLLTWISEIIFVARFTKSLPLILHTYVDTHHKCVNSSRKQVVLKIWKPRESSFVFSPPHVPTRLSFLCTEGGNKQIHIPACIWPTVYSI